MWNTCAEWQSWRMALRFIVTEALILKTTAGQSMRIAVTYKENTA